MPRFPSFLGAAVTATVIVGGAVTLAIDGGPYALKINGRTVSQSQIDDQLEVLHETPALASSIMNQQVGPFPEGSVPSTVSAAWLQLRVIAETARQELDERGEAVTRRDRAAVGLPSTGPYAGLPADFRQELTGDVAAIRALQRVIGDDESALAAELRAACPTERYVSHILVDTQAEAEAIRQQLEAGADFGEVASANSIDTQSAPSGGQLGCVRDGGFVEPFQSTAESQPLDVVSDPVQTEFGWHLLLVTDVPLETDIDAATLAAVAQLTRATRVDVDPRYGTWDAELGQVIAPASGG